MALEAPRLQSCLDLRRCSGIFVFQEDANRTENIFLKTVRWNPKSKRFGKMLEGQGKKKVGGEESRMSEGRLLDERQDDNKDQIRFQTEQ